MINPEMLPAGPPLVLRKRRLPWPGILLTTVFVGFIVACLGAVSTTLQTPAGPVLCRGGAFVAGSSSHPSNDGGTGYDIDSACVSTTTGQARHLNELAIIGVLWAEYAIVTFAVVTCLVILAQSIRGANRSIPIT